MIVINYLQDIVCFATTVCAYPDFGNNAYIPHDISAGDSAEPVGFTDCRLSHRNRVLQGARALPD
jgi:hypothetical protein